jgi:hypothetical protein
MRFESVLAVVPIVSLSLSLTASAEPVTVEFSGLIDEVTDPFFELPDGIELGAPFNGSFTIDPNTIGSTPVAAPLVWDHTGSGIGPLEVDVAGTAFATPVDLVRIGDGVTNLGDFWSLAISNLFTFPNDTLYVAISLQDSTATRITDASSFFINTSLAGWDNPDIGILIVDSSVTPFPRRLLALGTMTSLPEPDPALGLGAAVTLLGVGGRRRACGGHT